MLVTHQESDKTEQITKPSPCRINFCLPQSLNKRLPTSHMPLTLKFMLILQNSMHTIFKTMFDFHPLKGETVPVSFVKL